MQACSRFAGLHQNVFKGRNRHVLAGVHGSMGLRLPVASWIFIVLLPSSGAYKDAHRRNPFQM